jgi:hypothetical protein
MFQPTESGCNGREQVKDGALGSQPSAPDEMTATPSIPEASTVSSAGRDGPSYANSRRSDSAAIASWLSCSGT